MAGLIKLTPEVLLSFNAPFSKRQRTGMRVENVSKSKVMWVIKCTNAKLFFQPANGVLDVEQRADVKVFCEPLEKNPSASDRVAFEVSSLDSSDVVKAFDPKFFAECKEIQRKVLKVEYNEA